MSAYGSTLRSSEFPRASEIVREFLEAAAEAFSFLTSERGYSQGTQVLSSVHEQPVEPEQLDQGGFFYASVEFETASLRVRISYGDRELDINTLVSLQPPALGAGKEYGLWEWIAALGIPDHRTTHAEWVLTSGRMRETVRQSAQVLHDHYDRITAADAGVFATLELERNRRQEEWQEQERERGHRRIAAQAAQAFRRRDYAQVVTLLDPLGERLTAGERRKLEYARQHPSSSR